MPNLDRRLDAVQTRLDSQPKTQEEPTDPHTPEEIALWWASQWNWPRASQAASISQEEALHRWAEQTGWTDHLALTTELTTEAESLCPKPEPKQKAEAKQEPPPEVQDWPDRFKYDKRRWTARRRRGTVRARSPGRV